MNFRKIICLMCVFLISINLSAVAVAENHSAQELIYSTNDGWNPSVQEGLINELKKTNGNEIKIIENYVSKHTIQTDELVTAEKYSQRLSEIESSLELSKDADEYQIDDSRTIVFYPDGRFDFITLETEEIDAPVQSKAVSASMKYNRQTRNHTISDALLGPMVTVTTVGEFGFDQVNTPTIETSYSQYAYHKYYGVIVLQNIRFDHINDRNNAAKTATIKLNSSFGLKPNLPIEVSWETRTCQINMVCYKNGTIVSTAY